MCDIDIIVDEYKEKFIQLGFDEPKIEYSLSYSQGDGARVTGNVNVLTWINAVLSDDDKIQYSDLIILLENDYLDTIEIYPSSYFHMYYHENTMLLNFSIFCSSLPDDFDEIFELFGVDLQTEEQYNDWQDDIVDKFEALAERILHHLREICKDMYNELYRAYDEDLCESMGW